MDAHDNYSFVILLLLAAAAFVLLEEEETESEGEENRVASITKSLGLLRRIRKRAQTTADEPRKRKKHDYERAYQAAMADYLGPDPLFESQFERTFRVTRGTVEKIIQVCGNADPFFTHRKMSCGDWGTHPEVKVLIALKTIAFGCSPVAFMDYFQMSSTTANECVKRLCRALTKSNLRDKYLRKMTKEDARKVSRLHEAKFGVPGCIGCLDCMHIFWKNCPVAWQGQCKNTKEKGVCSIVLEGLCDYDTWMWHLSVGYPGTMNDINIWDQSDLLKGFLDGSFSQSIDFLCYIGDTCFEQLHILVDGMCPELSRFVKTTIPVPINKAEQKCAAWQEGMRKAIERAFGIAQRKFQILCGPVEQWCEDDIKITSEACFVLHNIMVEVRLQRNQQESEDWYQLQEAEEDEESDNESWNRLYNADEHYRLRKAIVPMI